MSGELIPRITVRDVRDVGLLALGLTHVIENYAVILRTTGIAEAGENLASAASLLHELQELLSGYAIDEALNDLLNYNSKGE